MSRTTAARRIDSVGRVTIPQEIRGAYGFTPGTMLELSADADCITLKRRPGDESIASLIAQLKVVVSSNIDFAHMPGAMQRLNEAERYLAAAVRK